MEINCFSRGWLCRSDDRADPIEIQNQAWYIMKTVLSNENKSQDNHWSFKSTAAGQAVLRASKLQVFYHAWCWFLLGEYMYSPGQSLVRCFHINMVHTTVVPRTEVHLRHESSNAHWFFEKPAWLQMLDCLRTPFVIHAAQFLGRATEDVNVTRDWE